MEQQIRKRRSAIVMSLTVAVIAAAVLVCYRFGLRLDFSADGSNTLSKASRTLYAEIPDQVRLSYYASSKIADRYSFPREIESLLRGFAAASRGKIAVEVSDPAAGKRESAVESLGVTAQQMRIIEQNEQRVAIVYSGIVVQYGSKTQVLPFVASTDTLEYDLVKAIKAAVADKRQVAAILVGDADKNFANDYQTLSAALQRSGWEAKELHSGDAVPPEASVLLVLGNDALDDYDAYRIDSYLASGGRALFAVRGVDVQVRQGLTAAPLKNDALLRALDSYGVTVGRDLVLDASSLTAPFQTRSPFGGQAISYVRYPPWVMTRPEFRDRKNPLTARSAGLNLFWPSPLELPARAGVVSSSLVKTTPKAWLQKNRFAIGPEDSSQYAAEAGSTTGQYLLAASLSGLLPSAYAGKPIPTRAGAAALPPLPSSPQASRIFVVGSSDFATDIMTIQDPAYGDSSFNASFIVSAADWLASGDELVAIKTRGTRDARLGKVQDPEAKNALVSLAYVLNLGIIPLLVLGFGLARSSRRRRLAKDEALLKAAPPGAAHAAKAEGGDR